MSRVRTSLQKIHIFIFAVRSLRWNIILTSVVAVLLVVRAWRPVPLAAVRVPIHHGGGGGGALVLVAAGGAAVNSERVGGRTVVACGKTSW